MPPLIRLLRPHQWTKNLFCLLGVIFSGRFTQPRHVLAALLTFAIFCAAASAMYILNDCVDRERDRQHPRKRHRPIASGSIGVPAAALVAVALGAVSLVGAAWLALSVAVCVALYMLNNIAYSTRLKHLPIIDVLSIALGFSLRLSAGIYAIAELPTTWITLCTFFLSVFLGFAKRRAELTGTPGDGDNQRPVLAQYSKSFLDHLLSSAASMAVITYALFTTGAGKNPGLVLTVPVVFYAVTHYKRLVLLCDSGEEPERILLTDRRIQLSLAVWLLLYFLISYAEPQFFRHEQP